MAKSKHNDDEPTQWVDNDEGLYNEARRFKGGTRAYVRAYRAEIDAYIDAVVGGQMPAHAGAYGGR